MELDGKEILAHAEDVELSKNIATAATIKAVLNAKMKENAVADR